MKLAPGAVLAGKYRLEHPLAAGGMGSIWVARHVQLDVGVAMKFMEDEASPAGRARFEREAKAAAALRNQHVVQVLDYGVEDGVPYLVMELLAGEDLGQRLAREHRISLQAASKILGQTARGLRTAHEAGVVHRDLKPANIFLAQVDDEEVVKILDFGIAKDTIGVPLGEATKTGELMGSPHYMSPEQVRGSRDLDPRSDLWSLAVILFRALTGRLPFPGEQVGNVIAQVLADPIPIATHVAADLPPPIDAFFARGLARDRNQRFQTARELAEAFAAVADTRHDLSGSWAAVPILSVLAADPPTRPRFASMTEIHPQLAEPQPPLPATGPIPAVAVGSTGGPVTQTTFPPVRTPPAWYGAATVVGAFWGVLLGIAAFQLQRPSTPSDPAPAASATEEATAAPAEQPTAAPAASDHPAAESTASASASSSATAAPAPKPAPPKASPPPKTGGSSKATPASTGKKK